MAGFDVASKLRRALGEGRVLPVEVLEQKLRPFDRDKDGALERVELAAFFKKHRVGGPWFCDHLAGTLWRLCELWYAQEVAWIKIEALSKLIHNEMAQAPRKAKRVRITPEGAQGYEALETLEDYERRTGGESGPSRRPRPRDPRARPAPARPMPRRPGPRR